MVTEFGHFAVSIAWVLSWVGIICPWVGLKSKNRAWVDIARQAITANFVLISIGMAAMIYAYITQDYSVKYVFSTSNSRLPLFYKIAGLWGGHEGSLLLWAWILSLYCLLPVALHWKSHPDTMPYLMTTQSLVLCGFLSLILFLSNPFERIFPVPPDGRDLNPLLQDPAMVFHPPMLYLGYVGLSVPYAFGMAALFSGRLDESWLRVTQRWTLIAWFCLTGGIFMGGYWAYYELGWGGYWGWDPVENASFMPWLVATAYLHSTIIQETRKIFKIWNLFLIILAFSLSLIGTFLVRSGILSSVHTFATDPGRGLFILGFLALMLLLSFGTLVMRSHKLKGKTIIASVLSREAAFLYNNLFFLVALATVFAGTLYPLFMEAMKFKKVSVGPPYYNAVFMPIALGLILLMGIGPYIPWHQTSFAALRTRFLKPVLVAFGGFGCFFIAGIRDTYTLAGLWGVSFVMTAIVMDLHKTASFWGSRRKTSVLQGLYIAYQKNPRRLSGILVHIGVLMTVIGIIFSSVYQVEVMQIIKPGETVSLGAYKLKLLQIYPVTGPNWTAKEGLFNVYQGDRMIAQLYPQKRIYTISQIPTTETAIHTIRMGHILVTLPEVAPDGQWARLRALHNPLVLWVWYGGGMMGIGVVLNLFRKRTHAAETRVASHTVPSAVTPLVEH